MIAGLVVAAVWLAGHAWLDRRDSARQRERGSVLFRGDAPVSARLVGHDQPLPAATVRCTNCHVAPSVPPAAAAAASRASEPARPYGGALDAAALTMLRERRGAPPSAYNAASLCALLRTGVDPAQVMISSTMPRYDVSPADCSALWAHLSQRADGP
jgi:hypothetical protein